LSLAVTRGAPGALEIVDVRLTANNMMRWPTAGDVDQLDICICITTLAICRTACYWSTTPVATVSQHAIARYFHRQRQLGKKLVVGNTRRGRSAVSSKMRARISFAVAEAVGRPRRSV
jgi:hypothetical protein